MKRTTIAAGVLALAAGLFFMPNALAEPGGPGQQCDNTTAVDDPNTPADETDTDKDDLSVDLEIGSVCGDQADEGEPGNGHIYVDGDDTNPAPASGYISAGDDGDTQPGICADDNGNPVAGGTTPTCAPRLPTP